MAPVLQCPDCGTKHPLRDVPDAGTFPCKGCGRLLKVPEFVPRTATSSAPGPAPVVLAPPPAASSPSSSPSSSAPLPPPEPPPAPTRTLPVVERNRSRPVPLAPPPEPRAPRSAPMWLRFVLWVVAVPFSFFVVFVVARAFGWFTNDQLSEVFLANSAKRFWPLVRLLPFVALLTAALVQGGVFLIERRRSGH